MNRAVTAALISALVIPGGGQYFLGRRRRAMVFAIPTLAAAGYFLSQIMKQANAIAEEIIAGRVALDFAAILARVHAIEMTGTPLMNLSAIVMIACWIASTLDAYRLGR
jgi:hypothetical protein